MILSRVPAEQVDQAGYYLRNIFRRLDRDLTFLLSQEGLTLSQMVVLRHVRVKDDTTLVELAETLQWAPSTISGIISRLERDGFLRRQPDPDDLRVYRLRITKKAETVLERTCRTYSEHLASILAHFSPEEMKNLLTGLHNLWQAVQQEQPCRN